MKRLILILFISISSNKCGYLHYQSYLSELFSNNTSASQENILLSSVFLQSGQSYSSNEFLEISKSNLTVIEGFQGDYYYLRLKKIPTEVVYIDINASSGLQINGIPNTTRLEFGPHNWDEFQMITIEALANGNQDGTIHLEISHSIVTNDQTFVNASSASISIRILDSDGAGIIISKTTLVGAEGGNSDQYLITLTNQPTADVRITMTTNSQIQILGSQHLIFTPSNWSESQTLSVTAVDDSLVEGAHTSLIVHEVVSEDPRYNGFSINNVPFRITDNDAPNDFSLVSVDRTNITSFILDGQNNHWTGSPGVPISFNLEFQITGSCNSNCSVPFLVGIYGSNRLNSTPDSRVCRHYSDAAPHPKGVTISDHIMSPLVPGIYMITLWRNSSGNCDLWNGGAGMINNYTTQGSFIGVLEVVIPY
ncbi:hypothetical protein P3G55_22880 [Leptospira sp. 96542]|nr:hypothetical protein [Leptospira sp. 96542]